MGTNGGNGMIGTKRCRVVLAYESYRVGDYIWPTGLLRDNLKSRGYIVLDEVPVAAEAPTEVESQPPAIVDPPKRTRRRKHS